MKKSKSATKVKIGLAVVGAVVLAGAAQASVLESELHYARRLRDKTNLITMVDQLALKKSSNAAIQAFANGDIADVAADEQALFAKAVALQMPGVAMDAGFPRGTPPGGAGGPPGGGAGGPPGGGGGGPPGGGAGGPPGGRPGGGGRGNGPGAANALVIAALSKLSGADFDQAYLQEVVTISEDVERNILGELALPGTNPELQDFSKSFVIPWAKNAAAAQRLLSGQANPYGVRAGGAGGPGGATFDKNGHYAGVLPAGELFGTVIK